MLVNKALQVLLVLLVQLDLKVVVVCKDTRVQRVLPAQLAKKALRDVEVQLGQLVRRDVEDLQVQKDVKDLPE